MDSIEQSLACAAWRDAGSSRVPYRVYTDPEAHREEMRRFFHRNHWCYVGLAAEVPDPGDFKRSGSANAR